MWPFSRRPAAPPRTWWRQVATLEDRIAVLEDRLTERDAEMKSLKGKLYAMKRGDRQPEEPPQGPNGDESAPAYAPRPIRPTVELSRRFRMGG